LANDCGAGRTSQIIMKRLFDLVVATAVLLALLPFLLAICLLVLLTLGRPVFFRQKRAGKGSREFSIIKIRTMRELYDDQGRPLPDEQRLTGVGRFLRRFRIDELPNLMCVLLGDMSIVGPRAKLLKEAQYLPQLEHERQSMRPGMTGWAQINGNTLLSLEDILALDIWYVRNQSLILDLMILAKTVVVVLGGEFPNQHNIERARRDVGIVSWNG